MNKECLNCVHAYLNRSSGNYLCKLTVEHRNPWSKQKIMKLCMYAWEDCKGLHWEPNMFANVSMIFEELNKSFNELRKIKF
jgi:hypothetical protein